GFPHSWEACCTCAAGPELAAARPVCPEQQTTSMPRGSSAKEVREYLRNSIRFLVLEPVRGVGKGEELSAGAIAQAFVSHFRQEKIVALAPEDAGGDADVLDGELGDALRMQEGGAPGNCGAPIMAGQKDFFPTELIGDGEDVGDEFP